MNKNIFNRNFFKSKEDTLLIKDDLTVIGKVVKERRELSGITRTSLSNKTRISVAVIEAIENGWEEQLPEEAYLSKMLITLEKELMLKEGSLKCFIKNDSTKINTKNNNILTPGNINIFSSWQGTFIYFILLLVSLLLINRQQRYLSIQNSQTNMPIITEEILNKLYKANSIKINTKRNTE